MALFGRYDPDFDENNMSKKDIMRKEIREKKRKKKHIKK